MSGVDLLPCPFCGGPAVNVAGEYVMCGAPLFLDCVGRSVKAEPDAWNNRTPAQPLDAATIERCAEQAEILYGGNGWHPYHKSAGQTIAAAIRALNTASTRGEDARLREALEWQPIDTFPADPKWQMATMVLCSHAEKRWVRFGRYYGELRRWYYSGTNERSQWAEQPGDAPTHWMAYPAPPALQGDAAHTSQEKGNG